MHDVSIWRSKDSARLTAATINALAQGALGLGQARTEIGRGACVFALCRV
jgi:hypothetical protein